jgi:hypothetical protein
MASQGTPMLAAAAQFALRPFGQADPEADDQLLHVLANTQVPQDPHGNAAWLHHRRTYDEQRGQRRHYIAVHRATDEPIAYAALEQQQADPGIFRIYLVFDPQRWSFDTLGAFLYQHLLRDATSLHAATLVCIEYATDAAFRAFLEGQGFLHVGDGVYNGFNIVRYEQRLVPATQDSL